MALNNILSRRETVLLPDGSPNAGGLIDIFEPNTAVRIATFKDAALTEQNANPVVLDGAGKASIWFSADADMDIRTAPTVAIPLGSVYVSEQSVNPAALGGGTGSGLVPNGSFEIDTDANDEPDGWTRTDEAGSNNFIDTLNSSDGLQSMRFESTGSGGGNIVTDDFIAVNDVDDLSVDFDLFSSVANVRNIVRVEWFDVSQVPISNTDVFDNSASNPLTFTRQNTTATPPAGARFAKIRLIGCDPSIATVGSTNFDRLVVFYPLVVSGAFDNLLLAGNTISSTNTDGDINLVPNGLGNIGIGDGSAAGTMEFTLDVAAGQSSRVNFAEAGVVQNRLQWNAAANRASWRNITAGEQFYIEEGNAVNIAAIFTPNAGQILRHANANAISTTTEGADITRGGTGIALLDVIAPATAIANIGLRVDAGGLRLRVDDVSGLGEIVQTTAGGSPEEIWASFARGGAVTTFLANAINTRGYTQGVGANDLSGLQVHSVNGSSNPTLQLIDDDNATLMGQLSMFTGAGGSEGLYVDSLTDSFALVGRATNAGSSLVQGWFIDPDNRTILTHPVTAEDVLRTLAASAGGIEVDNQLTGAGLERVLTESDAGGGIQTQNQRNQDTRQNTTTQANCSEMTGWTLEADTYYAIDGWITYRTQSVSGVAMECRFQAPGNPAIVVQVHIYDSDTDTFVDATDMSNESEEIFAVNGTFGQQALLRGYILSDTAGTLDFQWAQQVSSAFINEINPGSWIRLTEMPT